MKKTEPAEPESEIVDLQPIFGIEPGVYLTGLYAIIALLIVFFVLFYPGIAHGGTVYSITSWPNGASVWVDESRVGHTPTEVFVPAGEHSISISRPHFVSARYEVTSRRRVFGSLIVPRRESIDASLEIESLSDLLATASRDFAQWSYVGEASSRYQFPPVARSLAVDLAGGGAPDEAFDQFLSDALPHVSSEAVLKDLVASKAIHDAGGGAAGPLQIAELVQLAARSSKTSPMLALQVEAVLQPERAEEFAQSEWVSAAAATAVAVDRSLPFLSAAGRLVVGDTVFERIPAGTWPVGGTERAAGGGTIPARRSLGSYYIAETEVTVAQYQRFVADVPEFAYENRDALMDAGLVDEHYLEDWPLGPSGAMPVRYVSYHAASAYAEWFGRFAADRGLAARLPTEDEWEVAAVQNGIADGAVFHRAGRSGPLPVGGSGAGRLGLIGMAGNVWEWCEDWYAPYARLYPTAPSGGAHRVVRGGGWANHLEDFRLADRGSQEPSWCTPFLGFRIVLVEQYRE